MAMGRHHDEVHIEGFRLLADRLVDPLLRFQDPDLARDKPPPTDLCRHNLFKLTEQCVSEFVALLSRKRPAWRVVGVERIRQPVHLNDVTEDHNPAPFRDNSVRVWDGRIPEGREIGCHEQFPIRRYHDPSALFKESPPAT